MIFLPVGTQIWVAAGHTDMRKGFAGLAGVVHSVLEQNPASGHVFVFRGRSGNRIKVLWYDGQGFCLFYKFLERGKFVWPSAKDGKLKLTPAELSMLLEGIDWGTTQRTFERHFAV